MCTLFSTTITHSTSCKLEQHISTGWTPGVSSRCRVDFWQLGAREIQWNLKQTNIYRSRWIWIIIYGWLSAQWNMMISFVMIHVACCIKQSHAGCFVVGMFFPQFDFWGFTVHVHCNFCLPLCSLVKDDSSVGEKSANEPSNHKSDNTVVVSDRWSLNTGRK